MIPKPPQRSPIHSTSSYTHARRADFAPRQRPSRPFWRAGTPLLLAVAVWLAPSAARAQALPGSASEIVGRISGDAMNVTGASDFATANGRSAATLSNGSEITLPFGQARIDLADGGEIDLCAPAHLRLLESGGALTLALDYGRVHVQIAAQLQLTIYTPLITATPVAIGEGPRDFTVGLNQKDEMCAVAESGATRLQQQFSGQTILLPQGGELSLSGGQLNGAQFGSQGCHCEAPVARFVVPKQQLDLRAPVRPPAALSEKSSTVTAPISPNEAADLGYQMRVEIPLSFGASSPEPPPGTDPQTMLLVREVRVQSDVVYQGVVAAAPVAKPNGKSAAAQKQEQAKPKRGFWEWLFGR